MGHMNPQIKNGYKQMNILLPEVLHQKLKIQAAVESRTMNAVAVDAIKIYVKNHYPKE